MVKRKAYKLDLTLYVPPEGSKDPVIVEAGRNVRGFDLCTDGKDFEEALGSMGSVLETHIEAADEYKIDIWKEVELINDEDWDRFMKGE